MALLIALGHQKHVGKDIFVKFCIDALRQTDQFAKKKIVRRGLADRLYDFCYSVYGWAGFQTRQYYVEHVEAKEHMLPILGKTARELLIDMSEHIKKYDPSIWLNAAIKDNNCDILFISDIRYPIEFETCDKQGALLVNMLRPGLPIPADFADTALNGWDDKWELTLKNDGDLNNLKKMADAFIRHHILPRVKS